MSKNINGYFQIALGAILLGSASIFVKFSNLDTFSLAFGRLFVATLSISLWFRHIKKRKMSLKTNLSKIFFLGFFHALTIILFIISVRILFIPMTILLQNLGLFYFVLLSTFYFKEKFKKRFFLSFVLAFFGVISIFFFRNHEYNYLLFIPGFLAGISMSFSFFFGKIISKETNASSMVFYQNLIAAGILLPFLFFNNNNNFTFDNFYLVIVLGIVCTAIPFLLIFSGMKKVKGQEVGLFLSLQVVSPIILSFFIFNDVFDLNEIIGILLIVISLIILLTAKEDSR